jgi:hypothetical protein
LKGLSDSIGFRLGYTSDILAADACRDYLYLLGATLEEQKLLPELALEVKAREDLLLQVPRDRSMAASVISEIAAKYPSSGHLEALSTLIYIAATFTENRSEQDKRLAWGRILRDANFAAEFTSLPIPSAVGRAIMAINDAYQVKTQRLSILLQEADAVWMAEGQPTVAPEHNVDSFLGLAGRRYFLELARNVRFVTSQDQIAAIEGLASRLAGLELRLP